MSGEEQRPPTFEEAFADVEPRPGLEATLMAGHTESCKLKQKNSNRYDKRKNKLASIVGFLIRRVELVMALLPSVGLAPMSID
jgi:hypothetical protein